MNGCAVSKPDRMDQPPARFGLPKLRNPFVHRLQLSTLDKIQIVLLSVTLCPIRLLLVVLMLFFAAVFSFLALYGMDRHASQREPLPYWRNVIRPIPVFFCRMMFFAGGFHWITERGVRASSAEAPILVCGPHSSVYDAIIVAYLGLTSVVVKSGTENIPLVGTVLRYGQPILVHREDPDSRNSTVKEIRRRAAANGRWPQVLIFPEGTCTNQTCLISYKAGAFIPGVPVQPVCVKYRNRMHTTPWTWNGPSALTQLWLTFANWNTQFEIEFLPVYVPNEAEKLDPLLFGRNVREVMAKALGVPTAEYTYEDGLAMMHSIQFPIAEQLTYINSLVRTFRWSAEEIREMLPKLCLEMQIPASAQGASEGSQAPRAITMEAFADKLNVAKSEALQELFAFYKQQSSPTIDMRHFVVHLYMLCRQYTLFEALHFAFQVFDEGTKGCLSRSELKLLFISFGIASSCLPATDTATYEEFLVHARTLQECEQWFAATEAEKKSKKE